MKIYHASLHFFTYITVFLCFISQYLPPLSPHFPPRYTNNVLIWINIYHPTPNHEKPNNKLLQSTRTDYTPPPLVFSSIFFLAVVIPCPRVWTTLAIAESSTLAYSFTSTLQYISWCTFTWASPSKSINQSKWIHYNNNIIRKVRSESTYLGWQLAGNVRLDKID